MTDSNDSNATETPLARIERKRAERAAALKAAYEDQRAKDLEALFPIEDELGLTSVARLDVPFTPGLPTCVAVKTPEQKYLDRYRTEIKPRIKKNETELGDITGASQRLGAMCVVFPDKATFDAMCAVRPGLLALCGKAAADLASADEAEDQKI